jgi:hypothetical protein
MFRTEVSRARVVVATSLAIATLIYAVADRSPARVTTAALQTDPAREAVEAQVYRTDIPGKLEDALGEDFGGSGSSPPPFSFTSASLRRRAGDRPRPWQRRRGLPRTSP